jgi:hypothetical protein
MLDPTLRFAAGSPERPVDLGLHKPVRRRRGQGDWVASTPHVDPSPQVHPGMGSSPALAIPGSSGAASSNPSGSRHHPIRSGFLGQRGSKAVFNVSSPLPPFRPMPSTRCRSPAIGSSAAFRSPMVRRCGYRLGRHASRQMSARGSSGVPGSGVGGGPRGRSCVQQSGTVRWSARPGQWCSRTDTTHGGC